jgi:YesN/AraC family two-component response regulator
MGNILFVDDEKLILNSLKRGLKAQKFNCYYANSGVEALKVLENIEIDVVFSDMKMPHMSGLELLKQVDELYPNVVKVILSGYAQLPQLIATINQASIFKYVAKPWDLHKELIPVIKESLEFATFKKESSRQKAMLETKNKAYQKIFKNYNSKAETKDQSWDIIRIYHQVLMKVLKDQAADSGLLSKDRVKILDAYKVFTDYYLNEIKRHEIYFEPRRIINEIIFILKKDAYNVQVEIGVDETSKNLYEGRGLHIKPIIVSLIEEAMLKETIGSIKIVATEISREEDGNVHMMYLIEGAKRMFFKLDRDGYSVKLYKSLLNIFGGDLEFKEIGTKLVITMKVRLKINEQNEEELDEYLDS